MENKPNKMFVPFVVFAAVLIAALTAITIYVKATSCFVNSEDGNWRVGTFKEDPWLQLWTARVFYFGDEDVGNISIECSAKSGTSTYTSTPIQEQNFYAKILAKKHISTTYVFHDLHYGDPEFDEVIIRWVDTYGNQHEILFCFK